MKRNVALFLLLICALLFGGTCYLLIRERFETGDVYPPSSSLRSDPLGTMILFESLRELPGLRVDRDHRAANRLPDGRRTVYLHFAARSHDWIAISTDLHRNMERFLREGGRLVITLEPEYAKTEESKKKEDTKNDHSDKTKGKEDESDDEREESQDVLLSEKWGFDFDLPTRNGKEHLVQNVSGFALPARLKWHGDLVLKDTDASWRILYKGDHGPVMAEKKHGLGTIVIATDSYFVSNEALVRDRQPELLGFLISPSDLIVFDEAHLGIVESPGIAALARKYRLHGAVAALLVLAGLFIWKNSSSLPRLPSEERSSDVITGLTAGAGFVSLLKRNIPSDKIFDVCMKEWQKTFGHGTRFNAREKAAVEEIAREEVARPARERNPIAAYRKICAVLHRHAP